MSNLVAQIGANTSKFVEEVKSAEYMLSKYTDASKKAKSEIEKNCSATNEQVNAYKKVIGALDKVANGTLNTKQQQAALAQSIKELKIQWSNLSDAAKQGEFGKMLSSTLSASTTQLQHLSEQIKKADADLGTLGGGNARRQLMEMTKNLANLTVQYREMSQAEKESAQGQELANKLSDLRNRAGALKDTVGDVQQEITTLASDTPNLDAFNSLVGISADALSVYSSVLAKVTGDEKALKDAIATVMAVQSAANLLTKVANALQSSSAIMLRVRAVQEGAAALAIKVRTAAEGKGVIATKAAIAAQKVFNAVAKANPYVLLATAIIAVGAALYAFTTKLNDASEAEKKSQSEAEKLKQRQEDLRKETDELNETSAKTKTKFFELQAQWKLLRTEADKKRWITENKNAFSSLGISINNVKTAEDVFVKNTDAVIDALLQRAIAAKKAEQAADNIIKLEEKRSKRSRATGDFFTPYKKGDNISDEDARKIGIRTKAERTHTQTLSGMGAHTVVDDLTAEEERQYNAYLARKSKATREQYHTDIDYKISEEKRQYAESTKLLSDANKKLAALGDAPTTTGGGSTTGDKPTIEPDVELPEGSLAKINKDLKEQQAKLELAVDDNTRANAQKEIDKLNQQKNEIEFKLKPLVDDKAITTIQEKLSEASKSSDIKKQLDINSDIVKSYKEQYDLIQKKKGLGVELNQNEQKLSSIYEDTTQQVNKLSDAYKKAADSAELLKTKSELKKKTWETVKEGIGTLGDLNGAVANTGNNWKSLCENWYDMSPFEQVTGAIDTTIGTIENAIKAYESINKMITLFGEISQLTAAKKVAANATEMASDSAKTAADTANTAITVANDQAENASTIGKLGVDQAGAIAGATKSGARLPFPANLAAIAAGIAAVVAGFAMVFSSFADGGIVGNGSQLGDYNIARVNGGEMILNGTQQKRLFNLLNGTGMGMYNAPNKKNKVEFVIKGKTLKSVMRNYDNMVQKI